MRENRNRKLKIAVASSGLGHVARGVESWANDLGVSLARRGETVILYKGGGTANAPYERVLQCWERDQRRTQNLHHMTRRLGLWRFGMGSPFGFEQWTFALKLIGHLRREAFDILHVGEPQLAIAMQRANEWGLQPAKVVLAHETNEPPEELMRITYLQHLAQFHMDEIRAAGAWRPTWTVMPNFIDTQLFPAGRHNGLRDELGIPRDALVVLCAAAIKRSHKRVDYMLTEFAKLRAARPDLPVWLVVAGGKDDQTPEMITLGQNLIGDRVRFLVAFPRERMSELYRSADLFALCSLREMFGIVLLEALASGLPCLIHQYPVEEWIVGPGGQAIDMAAEGALAAAMARLLENRPLLAEMSVKARQYCVENFDQAAVVGQYLEYYQQVLQHSAAGEKSRQALVPVPAAETAETGRK